MGRGMASISGSRKKSGSTRSGDAGDKDRLIAELKERVTVLESESQLKQSDTTPQEVIDREPMGEYLALFQRMVDNAADMVFLLGPMGRILYANEAACKALGYTREELQSMTVFDINQKHHVDNWQEHEEALKKQGSLTFENVLKTKDNRLIPVENSANYVRLGDKEYNYSFIRDITEHKQMEEELCRSRDELEQRVQERMRELSKSEEKYRFLVENANSIIIRWDRQGNFTFFNEFAEKLFGYSKNEVLGKNVVGTIVPSFESTGRDLAALMEEVEQCPERYKLQVNENLCKNGDRVWIAWTNKAIRDEHGNVVEILSVGNNITERKRAEEALRESEKKFRVLAETSPAAIFLNQGEKYVYVNPMAETLTGYSRDELLSRDAWEWIHPEFLEPVKDRARRRQQGEELPSQYEVKYRTRGGREGWVDFTAGLIEYRGKPAILAMAFDVTKRKQAEEALKETKAQAELYVDLMGHDINNMNQVSMGFLELAHNIIEMDGKLGEDNIVLLDKAINSLNNSSQLIGNVRKMQRERLGLYKSEIIDVDGMVEEAIKQFHSIPGRDVKIVFTPRTRCRVRANSLLKDVFINLVGNAVKHSMGAITVSINIDEFMDNGMKYCRVAVEDNGPGIPDGLKVTLFDRLNLTTTRAQGKGFGICLIKMLVDDYHGKFWVEDRVHGDHTKGARFVVMLPAVEK
jgi:PAS domain S-box-containing protein